MVQVVLELCALGTIVVVDAHFICLINDGCKLLLNLKQVGSQLGLLKYGFGFGLNYQHGLGCFKPSFVKKWRKEEMLRSGNCLGPGFVDGVKCLGQLAVSGLYGVKSGLIIG